MSAVLWTGRPADVVTSMSRGLKVMVMVVVGGEGRGEGARGI